MVLSSRPRDRVYVEDWGTAYGSPYLIDEEPSGPPAGVLVEDGADLLFHQGSEPQPLPALAFLDGVRRAEAWLYSVGQDGSTRRGLAGAIAAGAVLADPGKPLLYADERVQRLAIWGSGGHVGLGEVPGGWRWETASIPDTEPDAPLASLQDRMRQSERDLALSLAATRRLVILDGPLNFVVGRDARITGYVKTHHRRFLPPEQHGRVPGLQTAQRTSLFAVDDRYSCYARIAAPGPYSGPWSGIVRLHLSGEDGLDETRLVADALCAILPHFAGVAYCDPRAPQNLQPIGALESHLRHLMGDAALATRAVRDAAFARNAD